MGVVQGAEDLVVGGEAGAGDAMGDHLGVAEDGGAGAEGGLGGFGEVGVEADGVGDLGHAGSMDHADGDAGFGLGEAGEVGFGADRGEGLAVDGGAVAFVGS